MTIHHQQQQQRTLGNARYGNGVVELDAESAAALAGASVDGDALVTRLRALFASTSWHPPLPPPVAAEVLALSHDGDIDLARVSALLEKDPLLAGDVLRVAQSPAHAPAGRPVTSLRDAVNRLGIRGVHRVVLEAALNLRVFRAAGYDDVMARLRKHSVAVAHIARSLCRYSPIDGEYAFMCGLLHDVGVAACVIAASEDRVERDPQALAFAIREVHEAASRAVAEAWRTHPDVLWVLAKHHDADLSQPRHPLVAALALAEHIAAGAGCALDAPEAFARFEGRASSPPLLAADQKALGLSEKQWALAVADAAKVLAAL